MVTDVPQWEWSKTECQTWIYLFLTIKLNYEPAKARGAASELDGSGPNLYHRTLADWRLLLGAEDGRGVFLWLFNLRGREGAVPETILRLSQVRKDNVDRTRIRHASSAETKSHFNEDWQELRRLWHLYWNQKKWRQ